MFYDTETTGLDPRKSSIIQLAGYIEVDDVIAETFNYELAPHPKAILEPAALRINKRSEDEIRAFPPMAEAYKDLTARLQKYSDRFSKTSKVYLAGYNNRKFDDIFLQKLFELCGDNFFMGIFYTESLDTMVLAAEYLTERRLFMPSFKLKRVAKELGLEVDENALHDALEDVKLTREVYRIVTHREKEPAKQFDFYLDNKLRLPYKTNDDPRHPGDKQLSFMEYKRLLRANNLFDGPEHYYDSLF